MAIGRGRGVTPDRQEKTARALYEHFRAKAPSALTQYELGWDAPIWSEDGSDWRDEWRKQAEVAFDFILANIDEDELSGLGESEFDAVWALIGKALLNRNGH